MNRLKELRKSKKLTQIELADKIKIPYRTIQRWENGKTQIKPDKAQKLADFFEVPVGYLLGYSDSPVFELDQLVHLLDRNEKQNERLAMQQTIIEYITNESISDSDLKFFYDLVQRLNTESKKTK